MGTLLRTSIPGLIAVSIFCLSATASAADQIYWGNEGGESISHANVSGGGGSEIPITGVGVENPQGLAIDSAAGKIYWVNRDEAEYSIRFANLDGSGGGILNTAPAPVSEPHGLAIYPAAGRIYWGNWTGNSIYYANLDGSGGGELDTTGALVEQPLGVAVYPAQNRIYWADFDQNRIDFSNLDGTGGGDSLDLTGGTLDMPRAVVIDGSANRIYWPNSSDSIGYASLNGGNGGKVFTDGLPINEPNGLAIDPMADRIYWASPEAFEPIVFASLAEGGLVGELDTTGANRDLPGWPVLLYTPKATAAPAITAFSSPVPRILRKPKPGRPLVPLVASQTKTLSCTQATWAGDLLESFLYRAPQSFSFQWLRNDRPIPGATDGSLVANEVGDYRCRVTASNAAGSTARESDSVNVAANFRLGTAALNTKKGIAKVPFATSGTGIVTLSGRGVKPRKSTRLRGVIVVKTRGKTKRKLESGGVAKVRVRLAFTPTGGPPLQKTKSLNLRLAAD